MAQSFWISTGDIREAYETLNIVSTFVPVPAPAFGNPDYGAGFKRATDNLAVEAQKTGANGVVWIQFNPTWFGALGFVVFASGTAVKVKA